MNQPLDTLPSQLVLPPLLTDRVRGSSTALDQIRGAADLPERLFFGDLDESSFQSSGACWTARYRGAFEMGGVLTFDGRQLVIDQTFLGAPIHAACHTSKLVEILRLVGLGSQAPLDDVLRDWIGHRMNVRVVPTPEDAPSSWHFPDGPMRDIWLPVPTHRMRDLAGLHCVLAGIEEIGAGLRGSFILGRRSSITSRAVTDRSSKIRTCCASTRSSSWGCHRSSCRSDSNPKRDRRHGPYTACITFTA